MDTTRQYPRTLDQAFPDQTWGDPQVMSAVLDKLDPAKKPMEFLPAAYVQAAEAATDVGTDDDSPPYPEGGLIAVCAVIASVIAALLLAHFVAWL